MDKYVMAIDSGTTSVRCILYDKACKVVKTTQKKLNPIYPKYGWVELDPVELWNLHLETIREVMQEMRITAEQIEAIGITNQRTTAMAWDKNTGEPVYNIISWQCTRTEEYCEKLLKEGYGETIHKKTGLLFSTTYAGTKLKWILDHVEGAREKAEAGNLLFGTIDTWLLWNLTGKKVHATDYSNACGTCLYNLFDLKWDKEILERMNIPESMMPKVCDSCCHYGESEVQLFGKAIPITAIAGDQTAALFGQRCFQSGQAKITYGTSCSAIVNIGDKPILNESGALTLVAWGIDGKITYAWDSIVLSAGAILEWIKNNMGLYHSDEELNAIISGDGEDSACYFVPALSGCGTPSWNSEARGTIVGISHYTNKNHIVRAAFESIAYQVYDCLEAMCQDDRVTMQEIHVNGGLTNSDTLMQFQADLTNSKLVKPENAELTAEGIAMMAGLGAKFWKETDEIISKLKEEGRFTPKMKEETRKSKIAGWKRAMHTAMAWANYETWNS